MVYLLGLFERFEKSSGSVRSRRGCSEGRNGVHGGDTNFPEFDVAIPPRNESALFFWNTLERPGSKDYDKDILLNVDMKLRHAGK